MAKKLPSKKKRPRPLRIDPTRTGALRKAFLAQIKRKFASLKVKILKLVRDEDIFGINPAYVANWCNQYGGDTCREGSKGDMANKAKEAKLKAKSAPEKETAPAAPPPTPTPPTKTAAGKSSPQTQNMLRQMKGLIGIQKATAVLAKDFETNPIYAQEKELEDKTNALTQDILKSSAVNGESHKETIKLLEKWLDVVKERDEVREKVRAQSDKFLKAMSNSDKNDLIKLDKPAVKELTGYNVTNFNRAQEVLNGLTATSFKIDVKLVEKDSVRASFNLETKEVLLPKDGRDIGAAGRRRDSKPDVDRVGTMIHEFAHAIELQNPGVLDACRAFWEHRCGAEEGTVRSGMGILERGRSDDFGRAFGEREAWYVGKVYDGVPKMSATELSAYVRRLRDPAPMPPPSVRDVQATEILSMGIEQIYRNPAQFAARDPEYFQFCLGALRGKIRGAPY